MNGIFDCGFFIERQPCLPLPRPFHVVVGAKLSESVESEGCDVVDDFEGFFDDHYIIVVEDKKIS